MFGLAAKPFVEIPQQMPTTLFHGVWLGSGLAKLSLNDWGVEAACCAPWLAHSKSSQLDANRCHGQRKFFRGGVIKVALPVRNVLIF